MSLRVWLPLNGSLENKGISNITVTNNGATINASGKIGSCYSFNGSTGYISLVGTQLFQIFTGGTQQFSITMWVYHADATRAILFGDYSTTGSINFNIELSTEHGVRFYWGGSPDTYLSNATVAASGWTHVTLTYNGNLLQSYINGVAKGSWSGTLNTKNKTSGEFRLGRDSRSGATAFNGKMNDFRVYNHCLSAAEVKEISQGLVLHYKLDGFFGGTGENLVINGDARNGLTNWSNWGTATARQVITIDNKKWFTFKTDANGNYGGFSQDRGIALYKPNTQYTISALMYASASASGRLWVHTRSTEGGANLAQYLTTVTVTTSPAIYTFTFNTGTNASYTINKVNLMIGAVYTTSSLDFYISDIKIEEGTKTTGWVPCKEESGYDITQIQDSSGYEHNGIITGTPSIINNTPRYFNGLHLGKARINSSNGFPTGENPNFTVAFWAKIFSDITYVSYGDLCGMYDTNQGSNTFRLELCGSPAGNNIMWFRGPSGQSGGGFNMNSSSNNGWFSKDIWHHIALAGDGTNKKYYCYYDGQLCQTYNGNANSWQPTGQVYLGDTVEATADFSDFRIYCTALSADDIKQLYQVSAKVDNLQNLHTFELIENQPSIKITKTGQLKCKELTETTKASLRADNDAYANNIIER